MISVVQGCSVRIVELTAAGIYRTFRLRKGPTEGTVERPVEVNWTEEHRKEEHFGDLESSVRHFVVPLRAVRTLNGLLKGLGRPAPRAGRSHPLPWGPRGPR